MTSKFEVVNGHKLRRKVRAIIANETGKFLLIQPHGYSPGAWTFVGGGIEDNETDEQAIVREIREETGLSVLTTMHLSAAQYWFCFSDRIKARRNLDYDGQIARVFFITVASSSIVNIQVEEVQAFCWVPLEEVEDLIKIQEQKNLFRDVIAEFQNHPIT